ncbi:hypothetical protein NPIL_532541, partial [Nephila pilipes]
KAEVYVRCCRIREVELKKIGRLQGKATKATNEDDTFKQFPNRASAFVILSSSGEPIVHILYSTPCYADESFNEVSFSPSHYFLSEGVIKLDKYLRSFRKLENISEEPVINDDLKFCEDHFKRTDVRKLCGRYSVLIKEVLNIDEITSDDGFLLRHQDVLRSSNRARPLRTMFNGSQKTDLNILLKDILSKGGVIQEDLFSILLRA